MPTRSGVQVREPLGELPDGGDVVFEVARGLQPAVGRLVEGARAFRGAASVQDDRDEPQFRQGRGRVEAQGGQGTETRLGHVRDLGPAVDVVDHRVGPAGIEVLGLQHHPANLRFAVGGGDGEGLGPALPVRDGMRRCLLDEQEFLAVRRHERGDVGPVRALAGLHVVAGPGRQPGNRARVLAEDGEQQQREVALREHDVVGVAGAQHGEFGGVQVHPDHFAKVGIGVRPAPADGQEEFAPFPVHSEHVSHEPVAGGQRALLLAR